MLVIADTSPLHYLVLIEQTDILPALFGHVIIPPVVASPPAWLDMRPPQQPLVTTTLRLGAGEREALSLAQELHADLLLLDDLEAREEAERLALAVMGTLRVLELASERGLLDFAAAITKLEATSFHMPAQLVQDMLACDAARKKPT